MNQKLHIGSGLFQRICPTMATLAVGALCALSAPRAQAQISLIPTITGITLQHGQLVATGVATAIINGVTTQVPFVTPINLSASPAQTPGTCPVLNLELAPIDLNLLGLVVDTSAICLDITAHQGGGLLGNLLCSVANLLNRGVNIGSILHGLTRTQATTLLAGLTQILNGALSSLNQATLTLVPDSTNCQILHLSLGPLDLNLLGLQVVLDNCANGPVTVDLTGQPGTTLGGLLCSLAGLDLSTTLQDILNQLLGLATAVP